MCMVVKKMQDTNVTYDQIVTLMHAAFKERVLQGLKYTCSYMDVNTYIENSRGGVILVAMNADELCGTAMLHINTDKGGAKYGYIENLAISPKVKRMGVGSLLLKEVLKIVAENKGDYLLSDTAVDADSAVKFHKKNGFKIVGLHSYQSTNYYSYLFRLQLQPSRVWSNGFCVKFIFLLSYIKTKMEFKPNGKRKLFYNYFCRVRTMLCKK